MREETATQILVPTDFSENSDHALRIAASLAAHFGATIHILHVTTLHSLGSPGLASLPDVKNLLNAADKAAEAQFASGALEAVAQGTNVIKTVVRGINPWEPIVEYCHQNQISLIVMAMRSGSGFARFLLGSVTERILRFSPCPVLVVQQEARGCIDVESIATKMKKIVVADDFSDESQNALRKTVSWFAASKPAIHVVHVVEIEVPTPYVMAGVTSVFKVDKELEKRVGSMLEERCSALVPADWTVVTELREGRAHAEVPAYADEVEADLLVVAGESQIDLGERIMGGTVERIARKTHCALLVV